MKVPMQAPPVARVTSALVAPTRWTPAGTNFAQSQLPGWRDWLDCGACERLPIPLRLACYEICAVAP